jgi:hypothetical protein
MISLLIVTGLLVAVLALFDFSSKLARVQTNIADLQQSQRIAQYDVTRLLRSAGRGGLPLAQGSSLGVTTPNPFQTKKFAGAAIEVLDDVAPNEYLIQGNNATPPVLAGTDVLTLRGVFNGQLYQVNYTDPTTFTLTGSPAITGTVTIDATTPTGIVQDLTSLQTAITKNDALVIVSAEDDLVYAVVEINPASCVVSASSIRIAFTIRGNTTADAYNSLSVGGTFPVTRLNAAGTSGAVGMVGVLEEYKFYVRNDTTNPALPMPHLSRARFFPNTATSWDGTPAGMQADIADNIMDFQVALGFDRDPDGAGALLPDGVLVEDRSTATLAAADEWLFNGPSDVATANPWPSAVGQPLPRLANVRINTVARTDRRDFKYEAPMIVAIENHTYNLTPSSEAEPNGRQMRMFRRRLAQTVVALRNVS